MQHTGRSVRGDRGALTAGHAPPVERELPDPSKVKLGTLAHVDGSGEKIGKTVAARQIVRDDGDEYWDEVAVWVPARVVTVQELAHAQTVHRRWRIATWALSSFFVAVAVVALSTTTVPDWVVVPPAFFAVLAGILTQRAANNVLHSTLTPTPGA